MKSRWFVPLAMLLLLIGSLVRAEAPPPSAASEAPAVTTPPTRAEILSRIAGLLASEGLDPNAAGFVILDITDHPPLQRPDEPRRFPLVYSHNPDLGLSTASVMKLYTTAAALHHLKPEHVFQTRIYADGTLESGTLTGDLRVVGGGDPFLVPERLMLLVQELRRAGLRHLTGRVLTDASAHSAPLRPAGWERRNFERPYSAPLEALSFAFNVVTLDVVAEGPEASPLRVEYAPLIPGVTIQNEARVGGKRNLLKIETKRTPGAMQIRITGTLPATQRFTDYIPVASPSHFFGLALRDEMRRQGITMDSDEVASASGEATGTALLEFDSLPLALLTRSINLFSNNIMAELIYRQMGAEAEGSPGDEAKGRKAVQSALVAMGLDPSALNQRDGSGLTRANQSTAMLTASLLARMALRPDIGPEFVSTLAVNGATGTLRRHLDDDVHYRRIRGKTGFINEVYGLAGYMHTKNGRVLAYCLLMNKVTRPYRDTWDNVIGQILREMADL